MLLRSASSTVSAQALRKHAIHPRSPSQQSAHKEAGGAASARRNCQRTGVAPRSNLVKYLNSLRREFSRLEGWIARVAAASGSVSISIQIGFSAAQLQAGVWHSH